MLTNRIIPCLDITNGRVVKGVNFVGLRDAGDPVELAKQYNAMGADELCLLDITASVDGRQAMLHIIEQAASQIFIPLTVGGGVNKTSDVGDLLKAGADKVSINSGAIRNPGLINNSVDEYGTQCTVIAIDSRKTGNTQSGWEVHVKGGRIPTGIDVIEWAKECHQRGAGEILLTSMDRDGTKSGYDILLLQQVTHAVNIPVIASGGAGKLEHIIDMFEQTGATAALLASLLHYKELTIQEIKDSMLSNNIAVRL